MDILCKNCGNLFPSMMSDIFRRFPVKMLLPTEQLTFVFSPPRT